MIALLVFFAEAVGSIVGFGSSTLLAPLAFSSTDFRVALIVLAWTHIAGMVTRFVKLHEHIDRQVVVYFGTGSVIGSVAGAVGAGWVAVPTLKLLLGLCTAAYGLVAVVRPVHIQVRSTGTLLIAGVVSGAISGLLGTGGIVQGAVLSATHLKKKVYLSTIAAISIAVDVARVLVYHQTINVPLVSVEFLIAAMCMAVIGSLAGLYIAHALPQHIFKRLIGVALLLVGLSLFWQTVMEGVSA